MHILALPVSGGGFVSQLAIIQHLCEIGYIPDITLASSGGNVAAYVAAAANWKWAGIERIARDLSKNLFISSWSGIASLSMIIGYFKGDIYNKGSGAEDFFRRHFTNISIVKHEIWTGTYNKKRQKARLFCNRSPTTCIVDASCIDLDLTQSMEPVFANGDIGLIAQSGVASASIPAIVPPQRIMDEEYEDGGVAGASPLTLMHEPVMKLVKERHDSLHITYVNSVDLSTTLLSPINNVVDSLRQVTSNLVRSQTVIDRLSGYNLLRCHPGIMNKDEFPCNHENLERVKEIQKHVKYSMLEIFPIGIFDVDITDFNGDDVVNHIRSAYKNCRCRLWWLSSETEVEKPTVCNILASCKNCSQLD